MFDEKQVSVKSIVVSTSEFFVCVQNKWKVRGMTGGQRDEGKAAGWLAVLLAVFSHLTDRGLTSACRSATTSQMPPP